MMNAQVIKQGDKQITQKEAKKAMQDYAKHSAKVDELEAKKKADLLKIEERYAEKLKDAQEKAIAAHDVVAQYALDNRETLCPDGAKSFDLGVGKVKFRLGKPKFQLLDGFDWEKVKQNLLGNRKLKHLICTKVDVDKTNLMKEYGVGNDELLGEIGLQVVQDETLKVEV